MQLTYSSLVVKFLECYVRETCLAAFCNSACVEQKKTINLRSKVARVYTVLHVYGIKAVYIR